MTAVNGRSTGGDTRVALRPLSLVEDGGDVVVGDPATGSFVAIPAIGGVVIRALQAGAPLAEAAAEAEQHAGEPVDVAAFVAALRELGFLDDGSRAEPARTAPVQQRRWLAGVPQRWAARLFGRIAWSCYAAALVFCVACFALRPSLWPHPAEVGRDGVVLTLALLLTLLLSGVHEGWHWLAARALGLPVRFGVDRRLFFLVFETDLSLLWTVPRRQRYGPQLAGLAIDSVVLAGLLGMQLSAAAGRLPLAGSTARLVAAVAYLKVGTMLWQCLVFLRTDLYGVLVTATGCRNLWAVKSLQLRQAFGRLTADQAAELAAADPRDVHIGRWFRWLYLAGFLGTAGYLGYFLLPAVVSAMRWSSDGLSAGPAHAEFWATAAASALLYLPLLAAGALWLAARGRRLPRLR